MTEQQLADLDRYEQSPAYNEQEKLVLQFAEQWTRQGKASAELVKRLAANLSPDQLVTLAATVGLANWTNRFNETFAVALP